MVNEHNEESIEAFFYFNNKQEKIHKSLRDKLNTISKKNVT